MGVVFALVGIAVTLCVVGGAHLYLWRRLVRDVSAPDGTWRRTGTVLAFALPLVTVATAVSGRAGAPFAIERVLAWPGYLWLALLLYLTLTLLAGEIVKPLLRRLLERRARAARTSAVAEPEPESVPEAARAGAAEGPAAGGAALSVRTGEPPGAADATESRAVAVAGATEPATGGSGPSRRLFVARTVAAGAAAVAATTVGAGAYSVLNGPTLKRITIALTKLPRAADGYRIAVVSDIHLGPILGRSHTQRIVDLINGTQPDLVTIVGDLVDGSVADLGHAAEPLRALRSRHGSFFVTGNHEYFGDAAEWIDHLRELNVHPLENARRELPHFDLAGVNDLNGESIGEGPDFGRALGDRDTSRASVLMAHQPVQIHDAVRHGVDLQFSGHSHGGQMWPGNYLAALANPTVAGLERYGDTQLYVTRGAGAWGPPVRVGADSDVTLVRLASKHA